MQFSEFTIRLIVLMLPGGVASLLVELLTVHKKWSSFRFVLYSVFLGAASYLAYQALLLLTAFGGNLNFNQDGWSVLAKLGVLAKFRVLTVWPALFDSSKSFEPSEIMVTCLIAVPLGLGVSALIQHKVLFRTARRLRISWKFGDESLYDYFLNTQQVEWVWIRSKARGLTYRGAVAAFSGVEKGREIVLRYVTVYTYDDSEKCYDLPHIYLTLGPGDVIEVPETTRKEEVNGRAEDRADTRRKREGRPKRYVSLVSKARRPRKRRGNKATE